MSRTTLSRPRRQSSESEAPPCNCSLCSTSGSGRSSGLAFSVTLLVMSRTTFVRSLSWDTLATRTGRGLCARPHELHSAVQRPLPPDARGYAGLPFPRPQGGVLSHGQIVESQHHPVRLSRDLDQSAIPTTIPGIFVSQLASIMPFRWLLGHTIGPAAAPASSSTRTSSTPGASRSQERHAVSGSDDRLPPAEEITSSWKKS